jgi:acylphosphatase
VCGAQHKQGTVLCSAGVHRSRLLTSKPRRFLRSGVSDGGQVDMPLALLFIDHMRDTKGYTEHLRSFCGQLGVKGTLRQRSNGSYDLLLMCKSPDPLKRFITMLKTTKIDVDSKGQRCKEKQSRVVLQFDDAVRLVEPTLCIIQSGEDLLQEVDSPPVRRKLALTLK